MVQKTEQTQDERLMAGLAHGSILLPMWGLILSGLIFVTQREKSEYVRQQAAQAVGWQTALIVTFIAGMGCYMVTFFGIIGGLILTEGAATGGPPPAFFLGFGVMGLIMLAMFAFMVIGIFGAVRAIQGRAFRYPLVGGFVARYLAQ